MAGDNLQDVYTQTVCPYSYFQVLGIVSSQPLKQNQIPLSSLNTVTGVITFDYPYLDHVSYLSIKAVVGNEEIYYQPLQIVTVWGTVARAGRANYILIIGFSLSFLICALIGWRRLTKNRDGY